jgi:NADP-dependent 3-hydroxy acid dehydrogenase YdfG
MDVTEPQELRALVDLAMRRFGRLDVLASIAGVAVNAPLESGVLADWNQMTARRDAMAMPPQAVAQTIAFAIAQPDSVDIGEVIVRPTVQP